MILRRVARSGWLFGEHYHAGVSQPLCTTLWREGIFVSRHCAGWGRLKVDVEWLFHFSSCAKMVASRCVSVFTDSRDVQWFSQFSMIFHVLVCFDLMFQIWGRGPSESHLLAGQICKPNNASRLFGHLIISVSVTALGKVLRPIPPASFSRTAPMVGCWRLWFHAHPPEKEQAFIYLIYIYIIFA